MVSFTERGQEGGKLDKIILSGRQARTLLGISSAEMTRLLNDGEIPAFRRGNRWCVMTVDLEAYAQRMKQEDMERRNNGT